jgi:hypothetical protein
VFLLKKWVKQDNVNQFSRQGDCDSRNGTYSFFYQLFFSFHYSAGNDARQFPEACSLKNDKAAVAHGNWMHLTRDINATAIK